MRCPVCAHWSRRTTWTTAPGQAFPFELTCPTCGAVSDVAETGYRLADPSYAAGRGPLLSEVRRRRLPVLRMALVDAWSSGVAVAGMVASNVWTRSGAVNASC
jgi:hypothetical protein